MNNKNQNEPLMDEHAKTEPYIPVQPDTQTYYCRPGMVSGGANITQLPDGTWKAVAPIGALFGSEVNGECSGIGATQEEALAALKKDQADLYESIWY